MPPAPKLLTLNVGSSSLKFALFETQPARRRIFSGTFDRIGLADGTLRTRAAGAPDQTQPVAAPTARACLPHLRALLEADGHLAGLAAIAQRIVHGGPKFREHQWVSREMLAGLREIIPLAPNHAPGEVVFLEGVAEAFPGIPQAACFDTVFHKDLLREAALLPLPRRLEAKGVRRYGFHGLSFANLVRQLPEHIGAAGVARGRIILAHLGNGASLAAVREGRSVDTTMGLTPMGGLVMATRSGDLDPGIVSYLELFEKLSPAECQQLLAKESGMKGVSETNGDVRDLLARERDDPRAAEALAVFCHGARKHLGALAAVLGGLDTLVFAGGIGENAAVLRAQICAPLGFLGIELDAAANAAHGPRISRPGGRVGVFVLQTDEEGEMAEIATRLLQAGPSSAL